MNPKLLYIREGDRLSLARGQMSRFGVTAVPVLDDAHRPIGIVSLQDLGGDDHEVRMSAPVITISFDASAEDAARELAARNVHHLVVVDDAGVAVGMVSALDVVRTLVGLRASHPTSFARF
jgi:CBS domain-containing protein